MKVTDKDLYIEPKLKDKLDLMIKRFDKMKDNVLLIDGDEGDGKTNMAATCAYYIAHTTNRQLTLKDNLYFDLDKLIDYATKTKDQIIWWDEGALGGLAVEWWRKNQIKFVKLLMVARKKRHFFIICIPKFYKLNEYLAVDRSVGLIHVYSPDEVTIGRFVYFTKKRKEKLYETWRKTKSRMYKKYYDFHGMFTKSLSKVVDEVKYDLMKDEAILSIGGSEETKEDRIDTVRKEVVATVLRNSVPLKVNFTQQKLALLFEVSERTIQRYTRELGLRHPTAVIFNRMSTDPKTEPIYVKNQVYTPKNQVYTPNIRPKVVVNE